MKGELSPYRNNYGEALHPDGIPELFTVKEAGKYLGIGFKRIYTLIRLGLLPPVQIAGRWRISRTFLDREIVPHLWKESEGLDSYAEWIDSQDPRQP